MTGGAVCFHPEDIRHIFAVPVGRVRSEDGDMVEENRAKINGCTLKGSRSIPGSKPNEFLFVSQVIFQLVIQVTFHFLE